MSLWVHIMQHPYNLELSLEQPGNNNQGFSWQINNNIYLVLSPFNWSATFKHPWNLWLQQERTTYHTHSSSWAVPLGVSFPAEKEQGAHKCVV